jgi:hypothetical protein
VRETSSPSNFTVSDFTGGARGNDSVERNRSADFLMEIQSDRRLSEVHSGRWLGRLGKRILLNN